MEWAEWMIEHQWAIWLSLAAVLVVLELSSLDLVFLMLAVGAFAGMTVSFATDNLAIQVLVAIGVAVAMLFLIRPSVVKRLHRGAELISGAQGLIGKEGFVLEPMTQAHPGRVKIGGDEWSGRPTDDSIIPAGAKVVITAIDGATALVSKID